jgi:hypothetical protein
LTEGSSSAVGFQNQPAWGFADQMEHLCCVFHRIYAEANLRDEGGLTVRLEEDRCYWSVTPLTGSNEVTEEAVPWLITYAQARSKRPALSFGAFSDVASMRKIVGEVLRTPMAAADVTDDHAMPTSAKHS